MYGGRYVQVYDAVMRHRGRDHDGEARVLADLISARRPGAASVLDVGCGTGLHLPGLAAAFPEVHGLDASADMLAVAAQRVPGLHAHVGDMREIDLGLAVDAVTCLFAVPHLATVRELTDTVARLVTHLAPGGVLVVEPWWTADQFTAGHVSSDVVHDEGITYVRLSHSCWADRQRSRIRMDVHHSVADPAVGIEHHAERVELTLFGPEAFRAAFDAAGCRAEHVTAPPFTWGLWVAIAPTPRPPAGDRGWPPGGGAGG